MAKVEKSVTYFLPKYAITSEQIRIRVALVENGSKSFQLRRCKRAHLRHDSVYCITAKCNYVFEIVSSTFSF